MDTPSPRLSPAPSPDQLIRWVPHSLLVHIGHFEFGRVDFYKRRIKWDRVRDFALVFMGAEAEYFAANLGTKKSKDVKEMYSEADARVTELLRRTHQNRNGVFVRLSAEDRDILTELRKYGQLRIQTVRLYRDAVAQLHDAPLDYECFSRRVHGIMESMLGYLQHPEALILRSNAEFELTALHLLLKGLTHIARFEARDALHSLMRARTVLGNWSECQRISRERHAAADARAPTSTLPGDASEGSWTSNVQQSLAQLFAAFGAPGPPTPAVEPPEERTLPVPIAEDPGIHSPLAVSPPGTSFIPSINTRLSPAASAARAKGDLDPHPKMAVDNKLFEWLVGAVNRATAKYSFVFQDVLLASRLRLFPKDRYQWADNRGCLPMDLLGPPPSELRRPFRPGGSTASSGARPVGPSAATVAALQSRVEVVHPLSLAHYQMDPIKRMIEFVKGHPGCVVAVLLDTGKLEHFSPLGGFFQSPFGEMAADASPPVSLAPSSPLSDSEPVDFSAVGFAPGDAVHADCCHVTLCQKATKDQDSCVKPDSPVKGVDAFRIIAQHPRGGPTDLAQDPGLKATVVSLILDSREVLSKEIAPHVGRVLQIPPASTDRVPYVVYLSQLDQATYACILSEKAKDRGKSVLAYATRLTETLRDSNQMGYLVTPKFDYEKNLI